MVNNSNRDHLPGELFACPQHMVGGKSKKGCFPSVSRPERFAAVHLSPIVAPKKNIQEFAANVLDDVLIDSIDVFREHETNGHRCDVSAGLENASLGRCPFGGPSGCLPWPQCISAKQPKAFIFNRVMACAGLTCLARSSQYRPTNEYKGRKRCGRAEG